MNWFKSENPVFVKNKQEFLSIWAIAHAWEGLDPESTDPRDIPASIQAHMDMVMLAYFRQELAIRQANGYRLLGHHLMHTLFLLDKGYNRLWDCLNRKTSFDKEFLDNLFVMRSEILRWCEKEFREPPACWKQLPKTALVEERLAENDDENDSWYDKLTQQRRNRVACLEVARHLWEQNQGLLYEQVRLHPVMKQAGLSYVFTAAQFKKWARPFAPEEAKQGGRRPQSDS